MSGLVIKTPSPAAVFTFWIHNEFDESLREPQVLTVIEVAKGIVMKIAQAIAIAIAIAMAIAPMIATTRVVQVAPALLLLPAVGKGLMIGTLNVGGLM
jgi:hypothetical protein